MSTSVQLFYYTGPHTSTLLPTADALVARLSGPRRLRFEQRIAGTQRALDLAALRVLELGMLACGHQDFKLVDIDYPSEAGIAAKPRWRGSEVDFSISHADGIAGCAIASGSRVGFDAEHRREIDPRTVSRLIRSEASIASGLNPNNALVRWTQIEAVLKAAGLGVMRGREIDWHEGAITLLGQQWWVHEIDCGPEHVAHVAVNVPNAIVSVRHVAAL